jgi:hypothetical protein
VRSRAKTRSASTDAPNSSLVYGLSVSVSTEGAISAYARFDFALEPSACVAGQRVYRHLTRRASGLEQRVEIQRTEIRVLERTIHQPVAVRVGDVGDVVPDWDTPVP